MTPSWDAATAATEIRRQSSAAGRCPPPWRWPRFAALAGVAVGVVLVAAHVAVRLVASGAVG